MKRAFLFCTLLAISFVFLQCKDNPAQANLTSGMQGQVYDVSSPGPTQKEPTPLARVSTVVVLDSDNHEVLTVKTDARGSFEIPLDAGKYYLRVSESPVPRETGPFMLVEGDISVVAAYYDVGMQ